MIRHPDPNRASSLALARRAWGFSRQVLRDFHRNQGLLLAGAVAYYTLLSIVPMLALILVGLSHFMPQEMAFSVLESTMAVIFSHRQQTLRRPFFISAIIPYVYILLLAAGFLLVTLIAGVLDALESRALVLFGYDISLRGYTRSLFYLVGMLGMVLMLTSLYLVMPVGHISTRHALSGAVTAALLWEGIRRILVWYYSKLSLVNVIYGSLATTVVALLSIEVAVIILLLGAQVIAEFDRRDTGQGSPPPPA